MTSYFFFLFSVPIQTRFSQKRIAGKKWKSKIFVKKIEENRQFQRPSYNRILWPIEYIFFYIFSIILLLDSVIIQFHKIFWNNFICIFISYIFFFSYSNVRDLVSVLVLMSYYCYVCIFMVFYKNQAWYSHLKII